MQPCHPIHKDNHRIRISNDNFNYRGQRMCQKQTKSDVVTKDKQINLYCDGTVKGR